MKRILLAALAIALAGCGALDKLTSSPATSSPASTATLGNVSPAEELVAYLARLKSLNESALNAEAARQRQAAQRDLSDVEKLKVAIALALTPQSEEGDVLAVVDPLAKRDGSADADVRAMASFLQGMVHERRRLRESAAAAGAKLRDERRARET